MGARYFINGGVNSNWSTSGNWSATDGGAASGVKPTASDDVHFTANSPSCVVDSVGVALSIVFTGYASTLTMNATLTISGSVTLVAAMTIAGASGLAVNGTSTLTSNGKIWPNALTLAGSASTHTLADNWDADGLLTLGSTNATTTINGFQITASAGLTMGVTTGTVQGTTAIILDGTGTVTGSNNTGALRNNLTINGTGTITFAGVIFAYNTGTFTYTAGTVIVTAGATLSVAVASTTLNLVGIVWPNVTIVGSITVTLSSNLALSGLLTLGTTSLATVLNGFAILAPAGIRMGITSGTVSGTTELRLTGTGTLDAPSLTTGRVSNLVTINVPGGTVTITSPISVDLGQVLLTAGAVVTTAGTWASGGSGGPIRHSMRGGFIN